MADLKAFRKKLKIKQNQAVRIFGTTPPSWVAWEKHGHNPPEYVRGWVDYINESPIDGVAIEKLQYKMDQLGGIRVLAWLSVEIWRCSVQKNTVRTLPPASDSPGRPRPL